MKKILTVIAAIFATGVAVWVVYFAAMNLTGSGPAWLPSSGNIAHQLETGASPLTLPDGFSISVFAEGLDDPRVMSYDPGGGLLVSLTGEGAVVSVRNTDSDPEADETIVVANKLNHPHGITTRCDETCKLYVAESDQVAVFDYDSETHKASNKLKLFDLPGAGIHYTRTITFLPFPNHDTLLVSVGSSCNVCNETDDQRAAILAYDFNTQELTTYASGLRNSVFMATHPVTGATWATEMGRDYLGDDLPPDEINVIKQDGDYGWPLCYGKNIHDTDFDKNVYIRDPCDDKEPSFIDLPAHVAPLGLAFIPEEGWPESWWYNLLVAEHGSWNSSDPVGYKIVRIVLDADGNYLGTEDFLTGFLKNGTALGRPVDILVQPGGTIYVSDDKAGLIYRISYTPPEVTGEGEEASKGDLIYVTSPKINATVSSPLTVTGAARGNWYFEASFPVRLYDANGEQLAVEVAQAQGDWMTTEYVPFEVILNFDEPTTETGVLVLEKDNPSGLAEFADELRIPVQFGESTGGAIPSCKKTGCSSQICSDEEVITTCEFRAEYACYADATCERQADGECGWTQTASLTACIDEAETTNTEIPQYP